MNEEFENISAQYEVPNKKRKFETTPSFTSGLQLPRPIEELRIDELKRYTREQLAAYLNSQGVIASPEDSKPSLKQRVKLVLSELERQKSLGSGAPPVSELVHEKIKNGSLVIESDSRICEDCKTRKSNKDCHFLRCKACCNAHGFNCSVHFIYPNKGQRTTPSTPYQGQLSIPHTPTISTPLQSLSSQQANKTPQQNQPKFQSGQTFWQQQAHLFAAQGNRPQESSIQIPRTNLTTPFGQRITSENPPPFAPILRQTYLNILQRVIKCPACSQMVSRIGSNFFLHLSRCNPDYFFSWITSGQCIEDLIPKEKEESPLDKAKQDALEHYKLMKEFMAELFSQTSVDEIANSLDSFEQMDPASIQHRLNQMVQFTNELLSKNQVFCEKFRQRSESFMDKLNKLKQCTTIEELEICKQDYEKEFGTLMKMEQLGEGTNFVERSRETAPIPPSKREPTIISL